MKQWLTCLRFDPLPPLLDSGNEAIRFFSRRDLLEDKTGEIGNLWQLGPVTKLVRKQQEEGSWRYPARKPEIRSQHNYNQLETYRVLGELVEKYGLNRNHPSVKKAAEFMFNCRSKEGDFRGIYGNQYSPNYTAAIMELLIKAGYGNDSRITRGFKWLISIRQDDGGWAIPLRTVGLKLTPAMMRSETIHPDRSKPSSHLATGVVLRAFAAHEEYRKTEEAKLAGATLTRRLLKRDEYPDRQDVSYWTTFSFPFWFTDLLSALDSLSLLGFRKEDAQISEGLDWLVARQQRNGLWNVKLLRARDKSLPLWIALAICRVLRRFYDL